jgi:high-affinity iron transporter
VIRVTVLEGAPRLTMIGLFPTLEAVAAQLFTLVAVIVGFRSTRRAPGAPLPAE